MSMRRLVAAAGTLAGLISALATCDGVFVEPATHGAGGVAVSFNLGQSAGGDAQAFDRADAARIRLQRRTGGALAVDRTVDLTPVALGREASLELELTQDPEEFDLTAQLLSAGALLFTGSATVSVRRGQTTDAVIAPQAVAASVLISRSAVTLSAINETLALFAYPLFATGDTARSLAVQWSSLNPGIVTVSAAGLLTSRAEGQTQVTAAVGAISASLPVQVQALVSTVTVAPAGDTLTVGEEIVLSAVARDANGTVLARTPAWASNNTLVASVDAAGRVRALSPGTATITATVDGKTGTSLIRVIQQPVTSVRVVPATDTLAVGATVQLIAELRTAAGDLVSRPVQWTSSSPAVAMVSATGLVSAQAPGTVTITAMAEGVTGTAQITVLGPVLSVTPTSLAFAGVQGGSDPAPQTLAVGNTGAGTLTWSATDDAGWLSLNPTTGTGAASVNVNVSLSGLGAGPYAATITISGNAANSPRTVPVTLTVTANPGQIRGRVTDQAGLPLAGAQIAVTGTSYSAVTNATGDYLISAVPAGSYSVSATLTGYVTQTAQNVSVAAGQGTVLDFQLVSSAPAAPTALSATAVSSSQIDLAWTDAATSETGFRIERCTGAGCSSFVEIATVGANATSYPNTGLAAGTSYSYRVRAYNAGGSSAYSNTATASTIVAPPDGAPSALTAAPVSSSLVNIAWTDQATNESGFRVERCTGAGCTGFVEVATVGPNVTTYQNSGLAGPSTYNFRVRAYNGGGTSTYSNSAEATTPVPEPTTLPNPPSSLILGAPSSTQVDVTWTDNATNEVGWRQERCTGSGCSNFAEIFVPTTVYPAQTGTHTTNYTASHGITSGTWYSYRIRTYNRLGNSGYANTATVVTPAPPVTAPSPPTSLAATAVSRRQVTLAWTDNSNNETGFRVERCTGAGCASFVQISTALDASYANKVTFRDTTATTGTYVYRVRAYNAIGNSAYSNTATVTTSNAVTPPSPPSTLIATAISSSQVNLGWTDGSSNEDGFYIERSTCGVASCGPYTVIATSVANVTGWSITGHAASTAYSYRVRAFNTAGTSATSNTATAITW